VLKNKPLVGDPDPQPGPVCVPGDYRAELTVGDNNMAASFTIAKDPRIGASPADQASQFALLKTLTDSLAALNAGVNRIRRGKRQLTALAEGLGEAHADLAAKAKTSGESLSAIEATLVDVHRQTPRDVLRNPAGLNDTLGKLFALVNMSDTAPTAQADAVAREIMGKVAAQLGKLDAVMAGEVAEINRLAAERGVAHVVG